MIKGLLNKITETYTAFPGFCNIILHMNTSSGRSQKILINKFQINPSVEALSELRTIFGKQFVWLS